MLSFIIVAAIAIAVIIGYKTNFNTGFFAIIFAYLIGGFALGLSPKEIIGGWPVSTMFVIFSVSLFYNFALVNGTLEKTARYLLYAFRRFPGLLPFALYFASAGIAALGAGFFTVMAFMAPITLLICDEAKMNKLTGAVAINCGALSGANFMTSGSGIIFRGLMDEGGYSDTSFRYSAIIFIASVVFSLLLISFFRFVPKSSRSTVQNTSVTRPKPYTTLQKKNLYLMLIMILVVLIFPVLHIVAPDVEIITFINSKMDVGLVAIVFSAIALFMKLAPQKDVLAKVPWNTIIMICGVGMLINVAIIAGTIDLLATWAGSSLPLWLVPIAFSIVGAIMSFFSSTLGVVCPALFPLVPALAATTGIHPLVLFSCIVIGAQSSAISPFSSGGSLIMGSCSTEEERTHMFPKLLFQAVPISIIFSTVFNIVLSFIL
ncbi:SLC13 family permease [Hespellia stercorisuis]|uniref:Transporter, UIT1 family n=1 Tax=Hespellia stercorisuis DSM 15480 TaxID=1121950 RepID=A0A1M6SWY1_9FIRM|nr:SLC13 family permease [Hespellia stercorisuis]SHK49078.1 transporter, UIT1 family [Hespellia stercorisuis DSM 15480]